MAPWQASSDARRAFPSPRTICKRPPILRSPTPDSTDSRLFIMALTIRSATPKDEASVIELWRACDLVASYNDPAVDFRFAHDSACSDILVGEDEAGSIVGTVMVGHDGHRGWLYYVASSPQSRGSGIGRQMVQAAEDWLRARDVAKAQLLVREMNTKVVSFYEHLGFEVAPRVVMGKWLK